MLSESEDEKLSEHHVDSAKEMIECFTPNIEVGK
jgi:hypothetical protein